MKKIYSFLMALCIVFSASANVFEYPIHLEQSNQIAATRVAKKVNVESMKKAVTSMQVAESFESAQVAIEATSKTAAKAAAATTGLQHDATSGDVERTYSTKEVTITKATGYFIVTGTAADGSDEVDLVLFGNADENTIIPVGTYAFATTQAAGTAMASTGLSSTGGLTYSFYGKTNADGAFLPPLYWLVGGTVEVSAADGKLTVEINAVNSNDVPVHIVCEYDLNTKQGLPYDATSGSVDRTYSDEDQVVWNTQYAAEGEVYLNITAADKSDKVSLAFFVNGLDDVTTVPAGTYPVATTGEAGTVYASPGVQNGSVYPSFYGKLAANGGITTPLYFLEGGNVIVENVDGHVKVTVQAVNSYDVPIHIVYEEADDNGGEEEQQGLPYDATEGAVDRTYTAEDNVVINTKTGYFQVQATAADGSDMVSMAIFGQADEETIIPVGTYEINDTQATGTVLASVGVVGQNIYPSFYGKLSANGGIVPPCYFFVDGTVEVSAADGMLKLEVNAVNSYDVPVHIVMEYDLNTKQGLQHDMTEGSVERTYSDDDQVKFITDYVAQYGELYLDITAADGSDKISVAFLVEATDPAIVIPAGTYPITNTAATGTVFASPGVQDGSIYPSYYGVMHPQGGISVPCYFMVGGQVVVENVNGALKVTIDALNSYDVPAHIVYEADPVATAIENVTVNNNASKVVENNQLFIIKDGVKYNVMGSVVK